MNKYAIYHSTEAPYAYAKDMDTLTLRVRTAKGEVKKCEVYYKDKYMEKLPFEIKEMKIVAEAGLFDYFQANISVKRNRYMYYFKLVDKDNNITYLNERGAKSDNIEAYSYIYPYIAKEDLYEEVPWLQEAIAYQIFPDRFCNGDPSINPEGVLPWGGKVTLNTMFGGDLRGVIDKLDYLQDLGVNLVYLTPIFKSNTAHKYNTSDYFNIDPQFGTVEVAKELVEKCHEKGMKIVLDAVFNHSGDDFFAFQDVLENQEESKYKDWYFIDSFPVSKEKINYYTFGPNHSNMPKLNTNNSELREYLLNVGEYWIKEIGIDEWRLDVCDEIGHDFWRDFKKRIKSVNSDAVIIGEIMHEANSFLKGDQLDGIMNYPFKNAVGDFFGHRYINVNEFSNILGLNRMLYMDSITKQMWNLIDSHDTKRFLTEAGNDIEAMKLAVAFQFTYLGIPYIYYGDEVGMDGGDDPQNRKCMVWNKEEQNLEMLDYYKKFIKLRKENKVLVYGDYKEIYCEDNVIAFSRRYNDDICIAIFNNNKTEETIKLPLIGKVQDLLNNKSLIIDGEVTLKSMEVKILKVN